MTAPTRQAGAEHGMRFGIGLVAAWSALAVLSTGPVRADERDGLTAFPAVAPIRSCASLADIDLTAIGGPGSRVSAAAELSVDGRRVCGVDAVLAPTVGIRVELPLEGWTQRYLQLGCGGYCGRITLTIRGADGCAPLAAGAFVKAATDMGHEGRGTEFARDPRKRADFAHRAIGLTARAAKSLATALYGQAPTRSYFSGCSEGGRQAMIAAQRYPDEFDGVVSGGPTMGFQVQNSLYHAWQSRSNTGPDGKPILLASRLPLLHEAALAACDAADGQVDRLVSAPAACRFDPETLLCPDGTADRTRCLTAEELAVAAKLYGGPRDPATGERLTVGGPLPGSELSWAGVFVPRPGDDSLFSAAIARDTLRNVVFPEGQEVSLEDLRFDRATFERLRDRHPLFDATNPDLSAFARQGGRLIVWHGWADQHVAPAAPLAYLRAVERELGREATRATLRLYMMPGLHHCVGGEGPTLADFLTPLMAWVETGRPPDAVETRQATIAATPPSGSSSTSSTPGGLPVVPPSPDGPSRSRPVYPYPEIAVYSGRGDPNAASSYRRAPPPAELAIEPWAGDDFFRPYVARER